MSICIETQRLVLRSFKESDAKAAAFNSQQPKVAHWMSDMVLKNEAAAASWIEWVNGKCRSTDSMQIFAIERKEDNALIGLIGFAPKKEIGNEVEILYAVADLYQGCGYATEAAKAVVWQAFEKTGLDMLSAIIKPENTESERVIKKLGFVYVDRRTLPYDGKLTNFDYYRLYHIDYIPNPAWDFRSDAEEMGEFFNRRADGYEAHMTGNGSDYEAYKHAVLPLPQTDESLKVLDLGCGTGLELRYLFERMPNAWVTCIDLSENMLKILSEQYSDKAKQLTVLCESYLTWDYPENTFDYVVSVNTLHHFMKDQKTELYSRILHSLKPSGMYIESDFIVDKAMMEQYQERYKRIARSLSVQQRSGYYHIDIPFTVEVQKELLYQAGFDRVESFYENIRPKGSGAVITAHKSIPERV